MNRSPMVTKTKGLEMEMYLTEVYTDGPNMLIDAKRKIRALENLGFNVHRVGTVGEWSSQGFPVSPNMKIDKISSTFVILESEARVEPLLHSSVEIQVVMPGRVFDEKLPASKEAKE